MDGRANAKPQAAAGNSTMTEKAQVLYDGHCAFCRKSVSMLGKLDWLKRLEYVDIRQSHSVLETLWVAPERLLEEMHVVAPKGGLYHGFAALRWMAWRLPLLWPIAPLLYIPGVP